MNNYFLQNYKIHRYFLQTFLPKIFYTKYFVKILITISCKKKFNNKIYKYFLKKIKIKFAQNINFFNNTMLHLLASIKLVQIKLILKIINTS